MTRETFYVQVPGKPLQLMTLQCVYRVENTNGRWEMTAFEDIQILNRINQ